MGGVSVEHRIPANGVVRMANFPAMEAQAVDEAKVSRTLNLAIRLLDVGAADDARLVLSLLSDGMGTAVADPAAAVAPVSRGELPTAADPRRKGGTCPRCKRNPSPPGRARLCHPCRLDKNAELDRAHSEAMRVELTQQRKLDAAAAVSERVVSVADGSGGCGHCGGTLLADAAGEVRCVNCGRE